MNPYIQKALLGGGYTALKPVLQFLGKGTNQSAPSAGTVTFSGVSFGTASTDRLIIVAIHVGGSSVTISNCVIGGVTATAVTAQGSGTNTQTRLYQAIVPTGTSGTVTYSVSGSAAQNNIGVWSIKKLSSNSPVSNAVVNGTTTVSKTITLTSIPADGIAIFSAETTALVTFDNGVTTDYNDGSFDATGGSYIASTAQTNFQTTISSRALIGASWR